MGIDTKQALQQRIGHLEKAAEELELRVHQQEVVAELGQRALANTELYTLLDQFISRVVNTLKVDYCAVLRLLPDGYTLDLRSGMGWKEGRLWHVRVDTRLYGKAGYPLLSESPVVINDFSGETRLGELELISEHAIKSGASIMVRGKPRPFGVLGVYTSGARVFTANEVNFLRGVSDMLTMAIERRVADRHIMVSLKEKEVLLKEVYHRVKNNIQVISSLLRLQAHHIENEKDAELFTESQRRIRAISLVHEKLYQSKNLADINFREYISDLVSGLFSFYQMRPNKVRYEVVCENIVLGVDTAIPCGLVINELVSNALKYAFPSDRSGVVRVTLSEQEDRQVTLSIYDNGVGLPEDVDLDRTGSLGLQLVATLAKNQLSGQMEVDRTNGTTFHITFKRGAARL